MRGAAAAVEAMRRPGVVAAAVQKPRSVTLRRAAVAAVAHGVSIRLQARVMQADGGSRPPPVDHKQMGQLAPSSTPAPKIVPAVEALPAAVEAVPAAVAALPAAAAVPPAARSKAAEAEFLAALDEL
mmetsp:Transcript_32376/g.104538  ORF Transcript_32376/g.104538 Transcript_32376/m.104538 type:complete len:127 (-) Transcript_32376:350-730(-)